MSEPPDERPWQKAYLNFRELERWLIDDGEPCCRVFVDMLYDAIQGRRVFENRLQKYRDDQKANSNILPEPSADLISELQSIADLRSSYRATPGYVFEDVYHLAFNNLYSWRRYKQPVPQASECLRFYRGQQNDKWRIGAKIYRDLPDSPKQQREAELRARAASACRLGHAIVKRRKFNFTDAMAVVQHYSDVDTLDTSTWLVDFSRDPWAALFFASDGGRTGDCGIVWNISLEEYARHSVGENNPIGPLQLRVPKGIPRIDNQFGVFIEAGKPQFFDQYVAFGKEDTRFRQHNGLRFEDPVLGITAHTMYPPDDQLREKLLEVRNAADCQCGPSTRPCTIPPAVFIDPLDPKTYEDVLTCWLEFQTKKKVGRPEPQGVRAALVDLARFHALLHSPAYVGRLPDVTSRSLNRLHRAFDKLYHQSESGEPVLIREAVLQQYIYNQPLNEDHQAVLLEALNEIAPGSN